ncbi:MAG TPA: hypothetical protein VEC12_09090, partial [Bacteroidia bacterium]|nr:hypothetical protein [Bacteroidia bacterium]
MQQQRFITLVSQLLRLLFRYPATKVIILYCRNGAAPGDQNKKIPVAYRNRDLYSSGVFGTIPDIIPGKTISFAVFSHLLPCRQLPACIY